MFVLSCVCCMHGWVHINLTMKQLHYPQQTAIYDKVTSPRLRATSAVIHLCQEKTGIKKEGLRQDSNRER